MSYMSTVGPIDFDKALELVAELQQLWDQHGQRLTLAQAELRAYRLEFVCPFHGRGSYVGLSRIVTLHCGSLFPNGSRCEWTGIAQAVEEIT